MSTALDATKLFQLRRHNVNPDGNGWPQLIFIEKRLIDAGNGFFDRVSAHNCWQVLELRP
jgi:hypothetical protein